MRRIVSALPAAALMLAATGNARADHKVYSPTVEPGVLEIEARAHRTIDSNPEKDDGQAHKYEIGYGLTSWWHTAVFAKLEKEPEADTRYSATAWENIFQLTAPSDWWIGTGLYLEYSRGAHRGGPDELEGKLLLETQRLAPFVFTTNLILNKEFRDNAETGTGFEYAVRIRYPWLRALELNVEAYGEPGKIGHFTPSAEQEHVVGPVLSGKFNIPGITGVFGYEAGYLFGVSSASPSGTVKALLEYEVPL
jgi:hypothetical protein